MENFLIFEKTIILYPRPVKRVLYRGKGFVSSAGKTAIRGNLNFGPRKNFRKGGCHDG
jgi:hypothetical protein